MKELSSTVSDRLIPNHNYLRQKAFPKFNDDEQEFIAFLAHEVRNPLANINLSTEMLTGFFLNVEQKMYLDIIMRNSVRISNLITSLLTYQKPEKEEASHSVNGLLDEVLTIVNDRMKLKSITAIKTFSIEDFVIIANKAKMKIAFTNIIINAIEAMPATTGILRLSGKYVEGKYVVYIEDNGCGISAAHLQSIFDVGFTNKPGGLGFGLQITKTILQASNVEIKVESNEGEFTRFILLFNNYIAADEGSIDLEE
ncbi:MAG: ATP-binding protein [Ginsengibacter sp.]